MSFIYYCDLRFLILTVFGRELTWRVEMGLLEENLFSQLGQVRNLGFDGFVDCGVVISELH